MRYLLLTAFCAVALIPATAQGADMTLDINQARASCLREATFMRAYTFAIKSGYRAFHRVDRTRAFCLPWSISRQLPLPNCHLNCHLGSEYCVFHFRGMFFRMHGAVMHVERGKIKEKVVPCP